MCPRLNKGLVVEAKRGEANSALLGGSRGVC